MFFSRSLIAPVYFSPSDIAGTSVSSSWTTTAAIDCTTCSLVLGNKVFTTCKGGAYSAPDFMAAPKHRYLEYPAIRPVQRQPFEFCSIVTTPCKLLTSGLPPPGSSRGVDAALFTGVSQQHTSQRCEIAANNLHIHSALGRQWFNPRLVSSLAMARSTLGSCKCGNIEADYR